MNEDTFVTARRGALPWAAGVDYSQAVVTNAPLVFAAGQGPFGPDGSLVGPGDPETQIRVAFQNLATVLDDAGASLATIVTQTVYLARAEDFSVFKAVRREVLSEPFPAATTLRVDLLEAGMLVEISAIAAVGVVRS
jgi:2-iminobutanoate/2-iminopropanoate deaminase